MNLKLTKYQRVLVVSIVNFLLIGRCFAAPSCTQPPGLEDSRYYGTPKTFSSEKDCKDALEIAKRDCPTTCPTSCSPPTPPTPASSCQVECTAGTFSGSCRKVFEGVYCAEDQVEEGHDVGQFLLSDVSCQPRKARCTLVLN